jgi:hypothetical protein
LGKALEVSAQHFAVVEIDLRSIPTKQRTQRCVEPYPIKAAQNGRDVLANLL